jgi:hypothetical protein
MVVKIHKQEKKDNELSFSGMVHFYGGVLRKIKEGKDKRVQNQQEQNQPIN